MDNLTPQQALDGVLRVMRPFEHLTPVARAARWRRYFTPAERLLPAVVAEAWEVPCKVFYPARSSPVVLAAKALVDDRRPSL